MKLKIFLIWILIICTVSPLISQTVSTQGNASANLIKPLSITSFGGEINFGEIILTGSSFLQNLSPQQGKIFRVEGHPNRMTSITFNSVTLSNAGWVTTFGGTTGSLLFSPNVVHTAASSVYENPVAVYSGNSYQLVNSGGTGLLYLWVGGSIDINSSQPQGDYTGTFNITVSY